MKTCSPNKFCGPVLRRSNIPPLTIFHGASLAILLIAFVSSVSRGEVYTDPPKPKSRTVRKLEGWTVRVDDRLLQDSNKTLGSQAIKALEARLFDIATVVAPDKLEKLRSVTIVLDLSHGKLKAMQYHPDADWLAENGYERDLVRCVHIPVADELLAPGQINGQPWCVLHELAHAYHDQVLSFEDARILEAYDRYKRSGHGDSTLHIGGRHVRHYALTDHKEFFAEMSESYFGTNDFFPFNRAELMEAEPDIYRLLQAIWGPVETEQIKAKRAAAERASPVTSPPTAPSKP